jgi:hypothetical protein
MHPAGLEPVIPASEKPQSYARDRAAAEIGKIRTVDHPAPSLVSIQTSGSYNSMYLFNSFAVGFYRTSG